MVTRKPKNSELAAAASNPRGAARHIRKAVSNKVDEIGATAAVELGPQGVRVNAVLPGPVRTPMVADAIARGILDEHEITERTPAGRIAQPEEMAGAVLYLVSDAASYTTGSCLTADGGWLA